MSKNWELKDEKIIHDNVFQWKIRNLAQRVFFTGGIGGRYKMQILHLSIYTDRRRIFVITYLSEKKNTVHDSVYIYRE